MKYSANRNELNAALKANIRDMKVLQQTIKKGQLSPNDIDAELDGLLDEFEGIELMLMEKA